MATGKRESPPEKWELQEALSESPGEPVRFLTRSVSACSNSGFRKCVNNFLKILFPQAMTRGAKGSENDSMKLLAGAWREKTGRIRGTQTKANEYEH
jgi:hypothetical protein